MNELDVATEIAYGAGRMIMKDHFGKKEPVIIKPDTTKLTRADLAANQFIIGELEKRFPTHSILSEEKKENGKDLERRLKNPHIWIADPVDGSEDMDNHSKDFAVMISHVFEGIPHSAAVYLPAYDKMFTAEKGKGAYLQDPKEGKRQIRVSQNSIGTSIISISRKTYDYENARGLTMRLGIRGFIREGSRGVRICSVAEGRADFTFVNDTKKSGEWDLCAPELILQEAGGKTTTYYDNPSRYNKPIPGLPEGAVMSNKIVHSAVLPLLREYVPLK